MPTTNKDKQHQRRNLQDDAPASVVDARVLSLLDADVADNAEPRHRGVYTADVARAVFGFSSDNKKKQRRQARVRSSFARLAKKHARVSNGQDHKGRAVCSAYSESEHEQNKRDAARREETRALVSAALVALGVSESKAETAAYHASNGRGVSLPVSLFLRLAQNEDNARNAAAYADHAKREDNAHARRAEAEAEAQEARRAQERAEDKTAAEASRADTAERQARNAERQTAQAQARVVELARELQNANKQRAEAARLLAKTRDNEAALRVALEAAQDRAQDAKDAAASLGRELPRREAAARVQGRREGRAQAHEEATRPDTAQDAQ